MARVIINSTEFNPFSFEEMLKPMAMYGQEYRAQQDALSELAIKSSIWEGMANEQTDPYAYKTYKKYADDLEMQAGQLAREGLSLTSRKGMLDMRARYSKEITPIENAYKRREELAAEQRKALAANPTLIYQRMANMMSLDDFIKNPSLDYGESYSGALLTQQVATKAAAIAKELRDPGENGQRARKNLEKILPYQYRLLEQHGFNSSEVLKAIQQDPKASSILTNLVDSTLESSGMANWADAATMAKARAYANEGLWNAVGQSEYKYVTDQAGLNQQQADLQDRNNIRQFVRQQAAKKKEEEDALKQRIALGADSFLNTSGNLSQYKGLLSTLFTADGKLKASYWGKSLDRNGNAINPLAVYEQYWRAYNDAYKAAEKFNSDSRQESTPMSTSPAYSIGRGGGNNPYSGRKAYPTKNPKEEALKAANAVLRQHNVTAVLTKDQYNTLKGLNVNTSYSSRKHGNQVNFYNTFAEAINGKGAQTSFYSTKMSDYSHIDGVISRNLSWRNDNGSYSGLVYSLTADGKKGEATSFKNLGFKDDGNGKHVTDIAYSAVHPNMVIVTIGSSKYLMAPEVLGGEYAGILNTAQQALREGASKDEVSYNTTVALAGLLNSYNPVRSKTSSEFE